MTPTPGPGPVRPLHRPVLRLWRQLSPRRRRQFALVLGLMLVGATAEAATLGAVLPFLAVLADPAQVTRMPGLGPLFGALGLVAPDRLLLPLTLIFGGIAVVAGVLRVLLAWASNKYVFMVGHDLGVALYERVLHQPYTWHVVRNSSEAIAANQKVQLVTSAMLLPLMQGLSACIIGCFIVAALLSIDPLISLVAFACFGGLYFGVSLVTRSTLRANGAVIALTQTQRIQAVQEGLGGIRDVLLDGSQPVFLRRFRRIDDALRRAQAANDLIAATPRFVIEAAGMVLIALLAFWLSGRQGGVATALPVLGALALGAQRLMPLMQQAYYGWAQVSGNAHNLADVLSTLEALTPQEEEAVGAFALSFTREIAFRNVSFRYGPSQQVVLRNVNLTIPKGARVGIVGKTGSGKSTLVDLLMGLLEPTEGVIEIDGQPLDTTARRAWQRQIAHVPQMIFLSDASVAENIAFGVDPDLIDYARMREAAQKAEIAEFVKTLPEGYATLVGERGARLSGGQRQRIGIARALYKRAQVLVFDEATSALDGETEATVMKAINALSRDLTLVIIAHRQTTVEQCELILPLEEGHLLELKRSHISANRSSI